MEPLRIVKSNVNVHDLAGNSFDLHMSRDMTPLEQESVQFVLSRKFGAASDVKDPSTVTVHGVGVDVLEQRKDSLQELVSEAEAAAKEEQARRDMAEAAAKARIEDARRRAEAIDWS